MINPNLLSDRVISDVCHNLDVDPGDEANYEIISRMSADEVFERFLNWNGIIGYGKLIREACHAIDEAEEF